MLKHLEESYKLKLDIQYRNTKFVEVISFLYNILNYSVTNKDIKSLLLFLYLHDTNKCIHKQENEDYYEKWIIVLTHIFAYETNIFTCKDVEHNIIKNSFEKKIQKYLNSNLVHLPGEEKHSLLFLKKNSWKNLKICSLKTYSKCIGRFLILFKKNIKCGI
jgi:hypothetical protein